MQTQNQYLDFLVGPSFQGVNRFFLLQLENKSYHEYYFLKVEIKDYNVIIDGRKFLDQLLRVDIRPYENNRKIATSKGDDYITGYLLDYPYLKEKLQINIHKFN